MAKKGNEMHAGAEGRDKAPFVPMSEDEKLGYIVGFWDNILTQLGIAFVQVVKNENWTRRDLASITGLNERGIGEVLSGRRKTLTADTVAVLARAMRKRPRLVLEDLRDPQPSVAAPARRSARGPRASGRWTRAGA